MALFWPYYGHSRTAAVEKPNNDVKMMHIMIDTVISRTEIHESTILDHTSVELKTGLKTPPEAESGHDGIRLERNVRPGLNGMEKMSGERNGDKDGEHLLRALSCVAEGRAESKMRKETRWGGHETERAKMYTSVKSAQDQLQEMGAKATVDRSQSTRIECHQQDPLYVPAVPWFAPKLAAKNAEDIDVALPLLNSRQSSAPVHPTPTEKGPEIHLIDAPISAADEVGNFGNRSKRAVGGSKSKKKVAGVVTGEREVDTPVLQPLSRQMFINTLFINVKL
ncbi:hypothetical protein K438DRAFT_1764795 [Mycena galopus ATCC 62051]|nr:hypothetical protein K438DRAFT_1764795 [Mycena galopus ATCC 62051]